MEDFGVVAAAEQVFDGFAVDVVVLVDDGVQKFGVVVFLDAEGFGHEGRIEAVFAGHVL